METSLPSYFATTPAGAVISSRQVVQLCPCPPILLCDQISPLHCTVPPRQACCLALQQARQVHCEVVLFCSIPTWQGELQHATIRRSLEAHKQWYVGSLIAHTLIYMYRVSSAEFLPHSIAHKLAGNVPCLGHVCSKMLSYMLKPFV